MQMSFKDLYHNGENYFKSQYWTTSFAERCTLSLTNLFTKGELSRSQRGFNVSISHETLLLPPSLLYVFVL